jgi:hypothetical protein
VRHPLIAPHVECGAWGKNEENVTVFVNNRLFMLLLNYLLIISGVIQMDTAASGDIFAKDLNTNWRYPFYINQNSKNQGDFNGNEDWKRENQA